LVYQERAYDFFMQMLDEVNYRIVRGILSANAQTEVAQVEVTDVQINNPVENVSEEHPLLRQSQKNNDGIKVIRVK
jgi:negative regulator of genetic competence, sporulation and motility